MTRTGISLLLAFLASASGCMVEPEEPPTDMPDAAPIGPGPAPTVSIGDAPDSTYWMSAKVTGYGPANGTVLVETPAQGAFSTDIGGSGAFCIDVPLEADTDNELTFQAVDAEGRYSEPVSVTITQDGVPPEGPEGEPARNLAEGGSPWSSMNLEDGNLAMLHDGNVSTYTHFGNDRLDDDYLKLYLAERGPIEKIRVISTDDCPAEEFRIMISDDIAAGPAIEGGPGWTTIEHVTNNTHAVREFQFDATMARYVGIQFLSDDCGWFGEPGEHKLRELEAWTPPEPAPGAEEAPSCRPL